MLEDEKSQNIKTNVTKAMCADETKDWFPSTIYSFRNPFRLRSQHQTETQVSFQIKLLFSW